VKPPPFEYLRPEQVDTAVDLLGSLGSGAKVLAGGQSLVPLLSMRLAHPSALVDINRLHDLDYARVDGDVVRIGALARHSRVLADQALGAAQPLLPQALRLVAHATIRNRGTTVGSIVHADPAGEMTAVLALLGGVVRVVSTRGQREIPAGRFFLGPLESDVRPDELAVEAAVPVLAARGGTAFVEVARRAGDYAVCGVAALVRLDEDGTVAAARCAYLSVASTPLVLDFTGQGGDPRAAADWAREQIEPEADLHASADYRRHLAGVLTERALVQAIGAARMSETAAV
jgi:carbon-monoxide dehydrogenase medium subunit